MDARPSTTEGLVAGRALGALARADFVDFDLITGMLAVLDRADLATYGLFDVIPGADAVPAHFDLDSAFLTVGELAQDIAAGYDRPLSVEEAQALGFELEAGYSEPDQRSTDAEVIGRVRTLAEPLSQAVYERDLNAFFAAQRTGAEPTLMQRLAYDSYVQHMTAADARF